MVRVDGELDPESGQTLITSLRAVMDADVRSGTGPEHRTPDQRRADAIEQPHPPRDGTVSNLILLCRLHHRMVHQAGFGVEMTDGRPVFYRPDGTVMAERAPPVMAASA